MQSTMVSSSSVKDRPRRKMPPVVADLGWEDASPFGLQGLARESLQIVKGDCITRLAISMALGGTADQIRAPEFLARLLRRHPEWVEEYHVVHLIERSLWMQGRSDLVMTLTRNPSQIPDNPPPEITATLSQAYVLHPQATVWYGVPLFGEETTPEGLPIPLTAAEIRTEADRRVRAAQQHALRWGWFYRLLLQASLVPSVCCRLVRGFFSALYGLGKGVLEFDRRARKHARRRVRAQCVAELEYCRTGRYVPPSEPDENLSLLDRWALWGYESAEDVAWGTTMAASTSSIPLLIAKMTILAPATIVSCDPFLFLELPNEPGKLRHLGHWYWQENPNGKRTLHLHA